VDRHRRPLTAARVLAAVPGPCRAAPSAVSSPHAARCFSLPPGGPPLITRSFCHIKGVGLGGGASLWEAGIGHWDDVPLHRPSWLTPSRFARLQAGIEESRREHAAGNAAWFLSRLPAGEHWRAFADFRDRTAYFDIETTGLDRASSVITTIALFDGRAVKTFVNGRNLERFAEEIEGYSQIVTYNGKCFDVPFIRHALAAPLGHGHLDLRYVLGRLGYKGGLKGCEKRLGVRRDGVEEVDGFMAVLLWREFRKGNPRALETLLAYNCADAVNLELLAVKAYNLALGNTPFAGSLLLDLPEPVDIPYAPDPAVIRKLKPLAGGF
jgi:uncharacterized protein